MTGRTFTYAMWTVGILAMIQLSSATWALWKRPTNLASVEPRIGPVSYPPTQISEAPMSESQQTGGGSPVAVTPDGSVQSGIVDSPPTGIVDPPPGGRVNPNAAANPAVSNRDTFPTASVESESPTQAIEAAAPIAGPSFLGPAESNSTSLSEALTEAAFSAQEIEDPILERLVVTGEELRAASNMQGALQALREAEAALPENPRIMSELGATYQQMGLNEKAALYWERVVGLGEVLAGPYFALAQRQLRGEEEPAAGAANQLMKIREVRVEDEAPNSPGQRVALFVSIEAAPESQLVGDDSSLIVLFYDRVNGMRVESSTADTSYLHPTKPYDWKGEGVEEIVVKYNQPVFSEEQQLELGDRKYYGYAIELYYQDVLQDRVVMPADIEELRSEIPRESPGTSDRLGPENALFPELPNF